MGLEHRLGVDVPTSLEDAMLWARRGSGSGGAAPGTPAYNPAWYALTDIYWDPQAGSDSNSGQIGMPLKTFAEIVRRYGSFEPVFNYGQSVTTHLLSSQSANVDPVFFVPRVSGGGSAVLTGFSGLVLGASSSGTTVTAKVRGAPGNSLQTTTFGGLATSNLVWNSTRNGYAYVASVPGVANLAQPLAAARFTATGTPTLDEDNSWTTGDTLQIVTPPTCNLKQWGAQGGDFTAGGAQGTANVQFITVADSSGSGASAFPATSFGAASVFQACRFLGRVVVSLMGGWQTPPYFMGCDVGGIFFSNSPCALWAGVARGGISSNAGIMVAGGDVINLGNISPQIGWIEIVTGLQHNGLGNSTAIGGGIFVAGPFWGAGNYTGGPGSTLEISGAAVSNLLLAGTLKFGANTTGTSYAAGAFTDGVNITPANIDSNVGLQDPRTGARICFAQ